MSDLTSTPRTAPPPQTAVPHTAPSPSLAQWLDRIDQQTDQAVAAVERSRQFSARVDRLRGTGAFGGVTLEVDAHGRLLGSRFDDAALSRGGASVATAVSLAHAAAVRDVVELVGRASAEAWPHEPDTARVVADEFAARLGVPR